MPTIDPNLHIGTVVLTVSDLGRSEAFYCDHIGLTIQDRSRELLTLGVEDTPLLALHYLPDGIAAPRTTGLYHFALLVPSRLALGRSLAHMLDVQTPLQGAADHFVSEALYLADPDGHGIEIYRDRPRAEWHDEQGNFVLTTDPFDGQGVMNEYAKAGQPAWTGMHPDTIMGHVHLQVADLDVTEAFYNEVLGFDRMATYPGARFISAGGYHHHLGLNVWAGRGAPAPEAHHLRLLSYEIVFSNSAELDAVIGRIQAANMAVSQSEHGWIVKDPAGITIHLIA